MKQTFGQYIRHLRGERDLTLREMAKLVGRSPAFISDLEQGHRFATDDLIKELAKVLRTSEDDLKSHDNRAPTSEMKDLVQSNPQYGYAFRKIVDEAKNGMSPEEIMKRFEQARRGKAKEK